MSLDQLLAQESSLPVFQDDRIRWHREVSRRAIGESGNSRTATRLCQVLLEGYLSPWILGYDFFPQDGLETMSWLAAGGEDPALVYPEIQKKFEGSEPRCQEVWNGEHVAYRCFTCGLSSNSCMCVYCFDASDHAGHDFRLYRSNTGGCCDCGDPLAWKPSGFCKRHRVIEGPRPSMLPVHVEKGARLALQAVIQHLMWSLRRCFYAGQLRPEVSGGYGVGRCLEWLIDFVSICPDTCKLAGEALNGRRDVYSEVTGWGNYCPAFSSELVADESATRALIRLACFLPRPLSHLLGDFLLKVLLDADFKAKFTESYVAFSDDLLTLLGAGNSESKWREQLIALNVPASYLETGDSGDDEGNEKFAEYWPPKADQDPPHYIPPKAPCVLTLKDLSVNARKFLDRIYCQLMHSESVTLPYAKILLGSSLEQLSKHFAACIPGDEPVCMDLSKARTSFYRMILNQMDLILQHDSVCEVIYANEDLYDNFLSILDSLQMLGWQRRREPGEPHVELPDPYFQKSINLAFEVEEQLITPMLRTCKVLAENPEKRQMVWQRLDMTCRSVDIWAGELEGELKDPGYSTIHFPKSRFFFRMLDIVRRVCPEQVENDEDINHMTDVKLRLMPSIKALLMVMEIQESKWVRNGSQMHSIAFCYLDPFCAGTYEADMLALRTHLLLHPNDPQVVDEILEFIFAQFGASKALRVMGSLVMQGSEFLSMRRVVIQALAVRAMSYSELDYMVPPARFPGELDQVLSEVADFHDASIHPGGLPAHYTLKTAAWDEVILGGLYAKWTRVEEENALGRYKRVKMLGDNLFVPLPKFPLDDPVSRAILRSVCLYGVCLKVLADRDDDAKTLACLLVIGAAQALANETDLESESLAMFPRQSFLDLITYEQTTMPVPPNVVEKMRAILSPPTTVSPVNTSLEGTGSTEEDVVMEGTAISASSTTATATGSAKLSKAEKAQKKAMRAFAKKQRKFHLQEEEGDEEAMKVEPPTKEKPPKEVCVLCRKDEDDKELLGMLAFRQGSNIMWLEESVCLEGQGLCVAKASPNGLGMARYPAPESISGEDLSYMAPRSIMTCVQSLRDQFAKRDSATREDQPPMAKSQTSARNIIHTCGHCVHQSCMHRYREVVLSRANLRQPYEGMGVIKLDLNELFCPVCRRVVNILIPLLPARELPSSEVCLLVESTTATEGADDDADWLASRVYSYASTFHPRTVYDGNQSAAVRAFFSACHVKTSEQDFYGHEQILLAQVHAIGSQPSPSLQKLIPIIWDLLLRHPTLALSEEEESQMSTPQPELTMLFWSVFVERRFKGGDRERRSNILSQDLTLILIEWIRFCPSLRFERADSPKVLEEARKVVRMLLFFAKLQDYLLISLYEASMATSERDQARQEEERLPTKEADALRGAAMMFHFREMNEFGALHRLTAKERSVLESYATSIAESTVRNDDSFVETSQKIRAFVRDFLPDDCLPFRPLGPQAESKTNELRRHASLLFGETVLEGTERPLSLRERETLATIVKEAFMVFFREIKELVGHEDRPMGASLTSHRLRFSAMLPSIYVRPGTPFTSLVRMPTEYAAFTVGYTARKAICTKCGTSPQYPAVCLSCGQLVCTYSECCREGSKVEFYTHGAKCPRGLGPSTGVYLLINSALVVVLLGESRHCVWGSLYLDAHDEEDRNLVRGKPLRLNQDRLNALEEVHQRQSWLLQTRVLDHVRIGALY